MPKYNCLNCGGEFNKKQSKYLPICPECGEIVEAVRETKI